MQSLRNVAALFGCVLVGVVGVASPAGAQTTPTVTLTPSSGLTDLQVIDVSVEPNTLFTPGAGIRILQCAPGATSNLQCDGNTLNADTVLVQPDGSVHYDAYTVYRLPNPLFGSSSIRCDETTPCVLYVGQDHNDFGQPKLFSAPFTVAAGGGTTTTTTAPPTTTTTAGPPPVVPETPRAALLPIGALAALVLGGWLTARQRAGLSS